ncbi:hypothetical protein [Pseudomonas turukhanskensis]|uniref:Filamentous hemagglutinin n=1 Tax=Pseudomonas turukhanskensis TaxID=1806536 RepID=A0A9W6NGD2_9PSED|nr:hypothetical protein [Pseudomonas turukhanskensis]GLK89727.1 hypothetical protein GCM10017655_27890 [Pseudomonas turukhanskensis]
MAHINIMSVVGSAVPTGLRGAGVLACWYVMVDGVARSGPYTSFEAAAASKTLWTFESLLRSKPSHTLVA